MSHRHPVGDEHPLAVHEQEVVLALEPALEQVGQAARPDRLEGPLADDVARKVEQPLRLGVDDADATLLIDGHHALAHAVQHRLALLQELRELAQLQPEGLPLEPPREQQRGEQAGQQRDPGVERDDRHDGAELVADGAVEQADRDLADDRAVGRAQGDLAPAERPSVPVSTASTVRPLSASGAVLTRLPMFAGLGWE